MIEQNEIDEKLLAYLLDELDDVGREEVKAWLEESERNKEYFREFQRVHLEFPKIFLVKIGRAHV